MGRKSAAVVRFPNTMDAGKWAQRITEAWQKQVPSIFEVGSLLEASQEELGKGNWLKMVREQLPFTRQTAHKLQCVAGDDRLRDVAHVRHLPASWGTLYELTKLTDQQFADGIESGAINPKMERKDVRDLRGLEPKPKKLKADPPHSLDEWCGNLIINLTEAFASLPITDHHRFLARMRAAIDRLEHPDA